MLDEDQQKVVNLDRGYYQIMAGAGSGKSTCLLHRSARLYEKTNKILCVTFTSEAAKNLRNRCGKLFATCDTSVFSTLHSLALRFANSHHDVFPFALADNPLADEGVAAKAVFEATNNKISYKAFTSWVSLQKRKRIDPLESIRAAETTGVKLDYALAYKRYQLALRRLGVLDFDDLIYQMVAILETRPDIRLHWQYEWVMQDEAQDACELDWRLLQLLTQKHKNLLCVGDAGQALFGFRGGVAEHFLNMETLFPGTKTLYLGNNYRSSLSIVDFGKKAYPYPAVSEHFKSIKQDRGVEPSITGYSTDYREAESVVKEIKKYDPDDCVILARTNLALRVFEEALLEEDIRYFVLNDSGFWESPEVQSVLYYIRCACAPTDNAVLGALRAPYHPSRFLKKKVIADKIKQLTETNGLSAWKNLDHIDNTKHFKNFLRKIFGYQHLPAGEAVKKIILDLEAIEFYKEEEGINPDRNPVANLKELAKAAVRHGSLSEFIDWVRRIQGYNRNRKGVCLSTVHQAKGKEWSHVFLVQCNQGVLPHSKAENPEEEKACFFVAVSRAEDTLNISFNGTPSQFLEPFTKVEECR